MGHAETPDHATPLVPLSMAYSNSVQYYEESQQQTQAQQMNPNY